MTRVMRALGVVLVVLGLFWTGRESDHGLSALWEHWWCPLPLAAILLGVMAAFAERLRPSS
jgi:hypothetical protein